MKITISTEGLIIAQGSALYKSYTRRNEPQKGTHLRRRYSNLRRRHSKSSHIIKTGPGDKILAPRNRKWKIEINGEMIYSAIAIWRTTKKDKVTRHLIGGTSIEWKEDVKKLGNTIDVRFDNKIINLLIEYFVVVKIE